MASQSGSGLGDVSAYMNVYDVYQDVDTITDSESHDLKAVYPNEQGQDLVNYQDVNTALNFNIPKGVAYTDQAFETINARIEIDIPANGTWTPIAAYDPANANTHCTIQNNANSLFTKAETYHNSQIAQTILEPGKVNMIKSLNESLPESEANGPNNFTYVKRCPTFDAAGGSKYALPVTLALGTIGADDSFSATAHTAATPINVVMPNATKGTVKDLLNAAPLDNVATFDESFEERCKRTGGKTAGQTFQISGKIPSGLFESRNGIATIFNDTSIILYREDNGKILENRTGKSCRIIITNVTLWIKYLRPTPLIMAELTKGIAEGSKQKIAYRDTARSYQSIAQGVTRYDHTVKCGNRPTSVIVGFQTAAQVSKRSWNHQDIKTVNLLVDGTPLQANPINISSWTDTATYGSLMRLYHNFLMTVGQHSGAPCITLEQFRENYCLWAFDTSASVTGVSEFVKRPAQIDITVEFTGGAAANALQMEVYITNDKLYTISGPQDVMDPMY